MKSLFFPTLTVLALGALALWGWKTAAPQAEPLPRLVQDMVHHPQRPHLAPPAEVVPYAADTPPPPPSADAGRELFLQRCAMCHGAAGTGSSFVAQQPGMPDVSNLTTTDAAPQELYQTLTEGRGAMPAFGKRLSDTQRQSLIQYISTLHQP